MCSIVWTGTDGRINSGVKSLAMHLTGRGVKIAEESGNIFKVADYCKIMDWYWKTPRNPYTLPLKLKFIQISF